MSYHPGGAATWNRKSIRESVAWMLQALMGETDAEKAINEATPQTYLFKEGCTLIALLLALFSIIPFVGILVNTSYFGELATPLSEKIPNPKGKWWKIATINTLIGGITFIILPTLGMLLGGLLVREQSFN